MDYLDRQRFLHEELADRRQNDSDKKWLIVDHWNEDVAEYDSEELARKGYSKRKEGDPEADIQLGWMLDHNKASYQNIDFRDFNPIED